eukprot:scaffold1457_cov350-Prasinococcus_capsulatus_cf.AAC.3
MDGWRDDAGALLVRADVITRRAPRRTRARRAAAGRPHSDSCVPSPTHSRGWHCRRRARPDPHLCSQPPVLRQRVWPHTQCHNPMASVLAVGATAPPLRGALCRDRCAASPSPLPAPVLRSRGAGAGGRRRLAVRAIAGGEDATAVSTAATAPPELQAGSKYIATNRFQLQGGAGPKFEKRWAERKSRLAVLDGFEFFTLCRRVDVAPGEEVDFDYISFTVWDSKKVSEPCAGAGGRSERRRTDRRWGARVHARRSTPGARARPLRRRTAGALCGALQAGAKGPQPCLPVACVRAASGSRRAADRPGMRAGPPQARVLRGPAGGAQTRGVAARGGGGVAHRGGGRREPTGRGVLRARPQVRRAARTGGRLRGGVPLRPGTLRFRPAGLPLRRAAAPRRQAGREAGGGGAAGAAAAAAAGEDEEDEGPRRRPGHGRGRRELHGRLGVGLQGGLPQRPAGRGGGAGGGRRARRPPPARPAARLLRGRARA